MIVECRLHIGITLRASGLGFRDIAPNHGESHGKEHGA